MRGHITAADADAELDAILSGDRTYPRWLATVVWAGGWRGRRLGRVLNRRVLPFFFQQVVGSAVITAGAVGLHGIQVPPPGLSPALVVAAGLTVLLSGLSIVGAVLDGITGFSVTAAGRVSGIAPLLPGLTTYRALFTLVVPGR